MKITVKHSTDYFYDSAVLLEPHTFRLRRCMNSTQRLLAFDIQVNPTSSADRQDSHVHTRAEVYLPGIEWRGYDPSRGLAVLNGHVVVAAGFHPELASPVAGWYSGGSGSRMVASDTNAG